MRSTESTASHYYRDVLDVSDFSMTKHYGMEVINYFFYRFTVIGTTFRIAVVFSKSEPFWKLLCSQRGTRRIEITAEYLDSSTAIYCTALERKCKNIFCLSRLAYSFNSSVGPL